jgi:predicted enzyme related to lactoylglutathione lyase
MPKTDSFPTGAPCWVDLFTSDMDRSRSFYEQVIGVTTESNGPEYGGYVNFLKDGLGVAGAMTNDGATGQPDAWSVYLAVEDAAATVEAAQGAGGTVIVPAMDVMTLGRMAVVSDPGGAAVGIWQPGEHKGFGVLAEPGAPGWFELQTRDYDAVLPFYQKVFGWETSTVNDTAEFRYTTLGEGEGARAGVADASSWVPEGGAHWGVYFVVPDADAAVAKAQELGGSVVQAPEDTPYGRLATCTDATGAMFKLMA